MRQRRSKNATTPQFGERDYLPTIFEDQPINISIPPSLKLSLLADCPSRNDEGDMEENTSDTGGLVSREVEARKGNNSSEESRASKLALDVIHDSETSPVASNLIAPKDVPNPPPGHVPRSNTLVDQQSQQLEWAVAKILAQPERASIVYRRMKRRKLIGQVSFLENLLNVQPE